MEAEGGTWIEDSLFNLDTSEDSEVSALSSCNTRKDRDKRSRRHTMGIFIIASPCGIVRCFRELFGSESCSQTYGIFIEFLSSLTKEERSRITHCYYDDMCHLKVNKCRWCSARCLFFDFQPFSENPERAEQNEVTRFFAGIKKYVDFFHFRG